MNVNDTEILNAIMTNTGYERTSNIEEANVVFLVTVSTLLMPYYPDYLYGVASVPFEKTQKLEFGNDSSIYDTTRPRLILKTHLLSVSWA